MKSLFILSFSVVLLLSAIAEAKEVMCYTHTQKNRPCPFQPSEKM